MTPEELTARMTKLREAAMPLIKLLSEEYHPHYTVIVTNTGFELVEGVCADKTINDFIKD